MRKHTIITAAALILAGLTTSTALAQADALTVRKEKASKTLRKAAENKGRLTEKAPESVRKTVESMKKATKAAIDKPAPDFTLIDINGKKHTLSEYTAAGNIVVLEWFNPDCPYVKEHYKPEAKGTSTVVEKEFQGKKVVWLRINSGSEDSGTSGKERNTEAAKNWGITGPILLDADGTVGRKYGAKVTPTLFIINENGVIAYTGAMDSKKSPRKTGETIYPRDALTSVLAHETVEKKTTKAVGCAVKYAARKSD
jgi:peroxiredoxin